MISLSDGTKKKIKDIKQGEYVLSLNEGSGKLEPAKVKELLDMGEKLIYELVTEDGKSVNTTSVHPYLVRVDYQDSLISNPPSLIVNDFPANSFISDKNSDNALTSFSDFGGCITNTIIPLCFLGGNKEELRKSVSRETMIDFCLFANDDNSRSLIPLEEYFAVNPFDLNKCLIDFGMFSSSRNVESDISFTSDEFSSILQSSINHFNSQTMIFFQEFFYIISCCNQFNNISNQNSGTFESRFAMTNFSVCNNILVNFNSHCNNINNKEIYKDFGWEEQTKTQWIKVSELKSGMEIAVLDNFGQDIKFVRIKEINILDKQHVYDIEVEGTHNFIGDDIVAHNTYIYGNTSIDGSTFFVDTTNDRVGIGTTSPIVNLDIKQLT